MSRALGLVIWALVLLRSSTDGRLDLLLRQAFHPLVALAGLVMLALAVGQLVLVMQERQRNRLQRSRLQRNPQHRSRQQKHRSPQQRAPRQAPDQPAHLVGLTSLIGLLLIAVPPNPSFADLARERPSDETGERELAFVLPPAQRSLTDWVRLLRSQGDPRLYTGDPVRISGFVLPMPAGPPRLARLLVRCCLADATPVGLAVRWPANTPQPKADQWLQIEGVMGLQPSPSGDELVVIANRITPIARPARPLEP